MFKQFHKRQSSKQNLQFDKAASFFARSIIHIQTRIADWLSKYEQCMTISQKKIALTLFCISMSILVGSFLYRSVNGFDGISPSWLQQPSVVMPETYPMLDSVDLQKPSEDRSSQDSTFHELDSINR